MRTTPCDPNEVRPLLLLDVDGVINDLGVHGGQSRPWDTLVVESHGVILYVPDYMPALVRHLDWLTDIHWCTTWRGAANGALAEILGIRSRPVVDDGTEMRNVDWKPDAAYQLAATALSAERRVLWIEDFYGAPPVDRMPSPVEYIDTATGEGAVLTTLHLPPDLRPRRRNLIEKCHTLAVPSDREAKVTH